jgi:hypothetical protein
VGISVITPYNNIYKYRYRLLKKKKKKKKKTNHTKTQLSFVAVLTKTPIASSSIKINLLGGNPSQFSRMHDAS